MKYDIVLAWLLSEELKIQCNLELKKPKYQKSKLIEWICHLSSWHPTIERRHWSEIKAAISVFYIKIAWTQEPKFGCKNLQELSS